MKSVPKVAIVHDWLIGGGAELVVLELHHLFPDAPIYTSLCSREWRQKLDHKVVTGYLQHWPFNKLYKFLPILRGLWFSGLNLEKYDIVISSSGNGEAKYIKVPETTKHISYCHSPTHFYWRHYQEYLAHPKSGWLNPVARLGLKLLVKPLRRWDYRAAQRPDVMIANSTHIQRDIKTYYERDSIVIHPPVDTERFRTSDIGHRTSVRKGFITVGRQVPYKRVDLIVDACTQLNLPLTVIGKGPEHEKLKRRAGPSIQFLGYLSYEELPTYLASSQAFILAAFEDFGITPVEALAAGTPVIAYQAGGALDYVVPGQTGEFFAEQSVKSLSYALRQFNPNQYDPVTLRDKAAEFSVEQFRHAIKQTVTKVLNATG